MAPKEMVKPINELSHKCDLLVAYVTTSAYDDNTMATIKDIDGQVDTLLEHLKTLDVKGKERLKNRPK